MKTKNAAIIGLLFLATCNEEAQPDSSAAIESSRAALGVVPPGESAVWQKVGSSNTPDGRYLQAAAFDETRRVVVIFGGTNTDPNTGVPASNNETWEWSPATGKWTNRTVAGSAPDARSGAAMVFDSVRGKFVLFGGRAGSGFNFEDTWEWDPATGAWTDVSAAGSHPSARAQHGMVYEKSTGKVLLFGGGRSDANSFDATGVNISLGDTWEYDPATYVWTARKVTVAPSVRHDFGMVWDSSRNKAVLFAGLQTDIASATGVPKQDTWEWDPLAGAWSERTVPGSKPSQRYGHAMAFDGVRNKAVVFGGWDITTGGSRSDLWDWEPTTGAWTQRLTGSESGIPTGRMYASMVADNTGARLELVAGAAVSSGTGIGGSAGSGGYYGSGGHYGAGGAYGGPIPLPVSMNVSGAGSRDVWELEPVKPAFTDRTPPLDFPVARMSQAMAYNPTTGKTYIFGGYDSMNGRSLDDLWEWDGKAWTMVAASLRPAGRADAAMAYDPARKSLILFGGTDYYGNSTFGDTWEWDSTRGWTQLKAVRSPDPLSGHGMVTDTARNKILLFGGLNNSYIVLPPGFGGSGGYRNPVRNEVWEWDGATLTWTNRTPIAVSAPLERQYPIMAYDEGRQKLFLYDGLNFNGTPTAFWEWDPLSAGWSSRTTGDALAYISSSILGYDSIRRREVILPDPNSFPATKQDTWEVDSKGPTWYVRSLTTSPGSKYGATMVFDKGRGVMVLFGGQNVNTGYPTSETWEYKVSSLGNGEGCTTASAPSCATGFCVDGVCCEAASCSGACKACNVAGHEGTCVAAKAGTEVPGSCTAGLACDGSGNCLAKNGQTCTAASACASGFCADGVCCDSACNGTCTSCNQPGQAGTCSPYVAGTDPQNECGKGTGVCKSTCDGVGNCAYPQEAVSCGSCMTCDGAGTCSSYSSYCYATGGTGGYIQNYGGAGGYIPNYGGSGGSRPNTAGRGGGIPNSGGGTGGTSPSAGGTVANPDGGTGANLSKSGCSCALGNGKVGDGGLAAPLFMTGLALLLVRNRRRRKD